MVSAEVVLVPEVLDLGHVQAGLQALQGLVVEAGHADAVGFRTLGAVLGAKLAQALFGTR
ncbi:hypothetical protein D3C73_1613330 [compost metagenome]